MKTIQMSIDARLLKAVDKLTKVRKTSRSAFIHRQQPVSSGEFDMWLAEQDWGAA